MYRPVASGGQWGLSPHRYSEPPHQSSAPSPDISPLTSHQFLRIKCGPPPLGMLVFVACTAGPTQQLWGTAGGSQLFRSGGHINDFLRLGGPNVKMNSIYLKYGE